MLIQTLILIPNSNPLHFFSRVIEFDSKSDKSRVVVSRKKDVVYHHNYVCVYAAYKLKAIRADGLTTPDKPEVSPSNVIPAFASSKGSKRLPFSPLANSSLQSTKIIRTVF